MRAAEIIDYDNFMGRIADTEYRTQLTADNRQQIVQQTADIKCHERTTPHRTAYKYSQIPSTLSAPPEQRILDPAGACADGLVTGKDLTSDVGLAFSYSIFEDVFSSVR